MSGDCGVDSGVIQFFVLSQTFCINKASVCLSIIPGERAGEGTGQGEGSRKARSGTGLGRRGRSSSLPQSAPESSPGRPKVPAMIAPAPPAADWQNLFCIFARLCLESRGGAACLSQSPDPAGRWGEKGNCLCSALINISPQRAFGCLFLLTDTSSF